jgi:putative hydrolase of the HAD superfamily
MIEVIAFDADDTLWHNEGLYRAAREAFDLLLADYPPAADSEALIDRLEIDNLNYYSYGVMGFILSLIEAAIDLTDARMAADDIRTLIDLGKDMLTAEVELFSGVVEILEQLSETHTLMLITQGDLRHQQSKIARSGVRHFFSAVEIVSEKSPDVYQEIITRCGLPPERFLMIGNSLRSDVLPVLEIGAWAIYVPSDLTWTHDQSPLPAGLLGRFRQVDRLQELTAAIADLAAGSAGAEG